MENKAQGNTNPAGEVIRPRIKQIIGQKKFKRILGALVLISLMLIIARLPRSGNDPQAEVTYTVTRGDLLVSVIEGGNLKAKKSVNIVSEVEGQATIISIVPEGTFVKEGEVLVELDSANLRERYTQQEITFQSAQSSYTEAREAYEIQKNENESKIKAAELKLEFAKMDLDKYLEGDWPQEKRKAEADITIAEEETKRAADKLAWTEKLQEKGYVTRSELEADKLALKKKELELEGAREKLRLLEKYTHPKQVRKLQSDYQEAKKELERVIRRANSQIAQAEAKVEAKKATFALQKARLEKLGKQVEKTTIRAPQSGLVVYASSSGGMRGSQNLIEEGAMVRERQAIITLPDISAMQVDAKVHETVVDKVEVGQEAAITVDAFPDMRLKGQVSKVAILPDAQSRWLNPDLKVYSTGVTIDEVVDSLKPGMSAKVEIIVARLEDVLSVPIQAVSMREGREVCYVVHSREVEVRPVEIGISNDKFVEIKGGLEEGEKVLLLPPTTASGRERRAGPVEEKERKEVPLAFGPDRTPEKGNSEDMSEKRREQWKKLSPEQRREMKRRMEQRRPGQENGDAHR